MRIIYCSNEYCLYFKDLEGKNKSIPNDMKKYMVKGKKLWDRKSTYCTQGCRKEHDTDGRSAMKEIINFNF